MLRNFTAALIATALVAGPALAAPPARDAGAVPAAAVPANPKEQTATKETGARKPVKTVKHARMHVRHRVAHMAKPAKATKTVKSSA